MHTSFCRSLPFFPAFSSHQECLSLALALHLWPEHSSKNPLSLTVLEISVYLSVYLLLYLCSFVHLFIYLLLSNEYCYQTVAEKQPLKVFKCRDCCALSLFVLIPDDAGFIHHFPIPTN